MLHGKYASELYKNTQMMILSLLITSDSFWCIVARENQPRTVKCAQMNPFHAAQTTRKCTHTFFPQFSFFLQSLTVGQVVFKHVYDHKCCFLLEPQTIPVDRRILLANRCAN